MCMDLDARAQLYTDLLNYYIKYWEAGSPGVRAVFCLFYLPTEIDTQGQHILGLESKTTLSTGV